MSIINPWPFIQWGLEIARPLPTAPGQRKYFLVATDYFIKWIKAEAYTKIREVELKIFVWKYIICRFRIPKVLVTDNKQPFDGRKFRSFCEEYNIINWYSTPKYSQENDQAEASNKTILDCVTKMVGQS